MRENQLQKTLDKEFKSGINFIKKWSWAVTAHTDNPVFEKENKHKRKWFKNKVKR